MTVIFFFFFFSSRRRHTRCSRDWSSDVCSSDLENARLMSETLEMKRTLETRKLVERAKGILQYKHNLTEEEAYLRLRNESRRLRRPMRDLAEAVIMADDLNKGQAAGVRGPLVEGE